MAELGLLHCWSTFPAVPRENARKTDKALVKQISKIRKINYPDGILSSFEEIGRLPGPPPFRLDPGAVNWPVVWVVLKLFSIVVLVALFVTAKWTTLQVRP